MAEQDQKTQHKGKGTISSEVAPSFVPGSEPLENEQHERFVQELLMLKPQVRAYLKAYPDSSYNAARANSSILIANHNIQDRLAFLKEEQRTRYRMDADDVHSRLVMAVNVDPDDLFDADGKLLPMSKLPPEVRVCIESIQRKKDGSFKVEFINRTTALQMIGRHLKMFTDKIEHSGKLTLEELVGGGE